jgi:hypothetical protein
MVKIQNNNPEYPQILVRIWNNRNSHSLLVGMKNGTATLEDSLAVSYKTKHILTIEPNNHAVWFFPKIRRKLMSTQKSTQMFVEALFIIAKMCKQPRCSSERQEKNLKCILLGERSQSEKVT